MAKAVRTAFALGATALTLGIAACGDDGDDAASTSSPAPAASGDLQLTASDKAGLKFDKKALAAPAGKVTITMTNPSSASMPHDVAIEGDGVDERGEVVQPGGTSEVSADLKPGTYTFYCSVGSHRRAGMEGTLTVQ